MPRCFRRCGRADESTIGNRCVAHSRAARYGTVLASRSPASRLANGVASRSRNRWSGSDQLFSSGRWGEDFFQVRQQQSQNSGARPERIRYSRSRAMMRDHVEGIIGYMLEDKLAFVCMFWHPGCWTRFAHELGPHCIMPNTCGEQCGSTASSTRSSAPRAMTFRTCTQCRWRSASHLRETCRQ